MRTKQRIEFTLMAAIWLLGQPCMAADAQPAPTQGGKPDKVAPVAPATPATPAVIQRETRKISGWNVHINRDLLTTKAEATNIALKLLTAQLEEIVRVVPPVAVAELQKVPLYFSPEYPGVVPRAEFHPDAGWLGKHGRDPVMGKCVEFTNIRIFEHETNRMPCFAFHELAHSYQNLVLPKGFDNPEIKAAYERAKASGKYDHVDHWRGNGRPNNIERAYAMSNPMEFFAESSEAFFGRNDFYPFNRDELKSYDPETFALLEKLWNSTPKRNP